MRRACSLQHRCVCTQQIAEGIRKFGMDVHHNYFLVALFDADDATVRTTLSPSRLLHSFSYASHNTRTRTRTAHDTYTIGSSSD